LYIKHSHPFTGCLILVEGTKEGTRPIQLVYLTKTEITYWFKFIK